MSPALGAERPSAGSSRPELTGERTWPGIPRENYWFRRHLIAYRWAAAQIASLDPGPVLDAGSGEGYGAAELSHLSGRRVTAVDLDPDTVHHVRDTYPMVHTVRANLVELPFRPRAFATTVSMQVIEHIWDPVTYLRELARCTDGPIFLSTPNRPVHSPHLAQGERPDNIFHVTEFDEAQMLDLLVRADPSRSTKVHGLQHGPAITDWEREHGSLPRALLEDQPDAMTFARSISEDDFMVVTVPQAPLETPVADTRHDLLAIWDVARP